MGVRALDRSTGEFHVLDAEECVFDYRTSIFKRDPGRWLVLGVSFAFEPRDASEPIRYAELARKLGVDEGDRAPLGDVRAAVLELRRGKGMVLDPTDPDTFSAGSFFTNPIFRTRDFGAVTQRVTERLGVGARPPAWPVAERAVKTSAAWLIERAGFERGHGNPDGIAISTKHTLALTNRGGGTTTELVARDEQRGRPPPRLVSASVCLPEMAIVAGSPWPRVKPARSMSHAAEVLTRASALGPARRAGVVAEPPRDALLERVEVVAREDRVREERAGADACRDRRGRGPCPCRGAARGRPRARRASGARSPSSTPSVRASSA